MTVAICGETRRVCRCQAEMEGGEAGTTQGPGVCLQQRRGGFCFQTEGKVWQNKTLQDVTAAQTYSTSAC